MSGSNRAVDQSRTSWRAAAQRSSAGSVWLQRVIVTLFGLALLVGFVLLLTYFFLSRAPDVHFVTLRISEYNLLAAPPIPYAAADHEALAAAVADERNAHLHRIDATESITGLDELAEHCANVPARGVLIVYLTAHGVAIDDQAWLLASNYRPDSGDTTGRIALADVLKTMLAAPARQKVLVLDTAHLDQAPEQGLWVNEFPRLVERDVKALSADKQTFYVLLPNRFLERSHVSPLEQRSSFNYYFAQGWDGAAEPADNGDEKLTLGEWFAYTRDKTSAWVWNASGKTNQQTPTLLCAGAGQVEPATANDFLLRRLPPPTEIAKAEPKQDEPPADSKQKEKQTAALTRPITRPVSSLAAYTPKLLAQATTDNNPPANKAATEPPAANPPVPAASPAPPATPTPVPPAPPAEPPFVPDAQTQALAQAQEARTALDQAWFGPTGSTPTWTPADFAPQLWRQLARQSQGNERVTLAGGTVGNANPAAETRTLDDLKGLWLRSPAVAQMQAQAALHEAVVARDRALLNLAEVRRLSTFRPVDGWPNNYAGQVERLFRETADLDRVLANPLTLDDSKQLVSRSVVLSPGTPLKLSAAARNLDQLFSEVLAATIDPRKDPQLANTVLAELLHSPLLNDTQRQEARAAWQQRRGLLPKFDAPNLRGPDTTDISNWRSKRVEQLRQQARLAVETTQVVVHDMTPEIKGLLAGCADNAELTEADLGKLNHCGASLNAVRSALFKQVEALATSNALANEPFVQAERTIRWLADSNGSAINNAWVKILQHRQYTIELPPQRLAINGPVGSTTTSAGSPIALSASGSSFTWHVGPATQLPAETVLKLEYDDKLLQVESSTGQALPARGSITVRSADKTGDDMVPLTLRIAPRPGEESGKQATLTFRSVGVPTLTATTSFQLPEPKWLDLVVRAWPGTVADLSPQAAADAEGLVGYQGAVAANGFSTVLLQPFPSGSSPYALRVTNRAQKPRKVTMRVWTVPHDPQRSSLVAWQPWEASGELNRAAVPLSEQTLEIPAAGSLDLSLFAPPAPPAANSPPPAAPPPTSPAGAIHVEQGILCEFLSTDGFAPPQRLWLDVDPLHPSQYIDVSFTPNTTKRNLTARIGLQAEGARRRPTHESEIRWENLAATDPLKPAGAAGKQDLLQQALTLTEPLPPGEDNTTVVLSVDGYPRAFEYRAQLFGKAERVQANRSHLRLFLLTKDKEQKPVVITDRNRYFNTLDDLAFYVQADVPPRGFSPDLYQIRVHVDQAADTDSQGIDTAREFNADRTFDVELIKAEAPTPRFLLRTKVDDLRGNLRLAGLTNRKVPIKAEIRRRDREGRLQGAPLTVSDYIVLDTNAPELATVPREQSVTIGEPLRLSLKLSDRVAGVREAVWSFQLDPQGNLKEPQPLELRPLAGNTCEALLELPTQEWKPGSRKLYVQATDKAGNTNAEPWAFPVRVVAPVGEPMTVKKEKNSLLVYVRFRGEGIEGAKVSISGPESHNGKTDGKGLARFDDLPPGEYTAKLTTGVHSVNNVRREAEAAKTSVAAPPKPPAEVELNLK